MNIRTRKALTTLGLALLVTLPLWLPILMLVCLGIATQFARTTITFRNDSGGLCDIRATIGHLGRDTQDRAIHFRLSVGGSETVEVEDGVKQVRYTVEDREGEIIFDMWHGEHVVLALDSDRALKQVFARPD